MPACVTKEPANLPRNRMTKLERVVSTDKAQLYTPELLTLAIGLAEYPLNPAHARQAEARSRVCGSVVAASLDLDADNQVIAFGTRVSACAVGQAAAALFARAIVGRNAAAVYDVRQALEEWLSGSGTMPRWPGLKVLAPALPHKGRHAAIMLPWDAALQALSISGPAD